jgi:hypothetical protein
MARSPLTWVDEFFGPAIVRLGSFLFPKRPILEFEAGTGVDIEVDDSTEHKSTVVRISRFGGAPGGAVGAVQYHGVDGEDPIFAGTDKLNVNDDGELVHSGKPVHEEAWADFVDIAGDGHSFARTQWPDKLTTNATPTVIATIDVNAAEHGDCGITVVAEVAYSYVSGGTTKCGKFSKDSLFSRTGGVLQRDGIVNNSQGALIKGAATGGIDIVISGNDTITVVATGIAATNIRWKTSLHVQVPVVPS